MSSSTRNLRKSVLCTAMGLCLSSLVAGPVLAQSVTGAVAGHATSGTQVTVTNSANGLSRTATADSDGNYRIGQLPPGEYMLSAGGATPVAVEVPLGGTTTVNLGSGGAVDLAAVHVVGSRVVNRVDTHSTESSMNITREELARLPVDQSLSSVALLAPGVVASGATFGGLTFGGASVAENVVYINGLDVTDPYRRQGFSTVPFAFFDQFQVKTGGYSAEFGRSTGGVINAVTRSGGNEFHGGLQLTMEPSSWASEKEDHFHKDGTIDERDRTSRDESPFYKANAWASGPIMKDRLFFFAMYEKRDADSQDVDTTEAWKTKSGNDFWGAKLDWQLNDNNLVEFLAFSDKANSTTNSYDYDWDTETYSASTGETTAGSGGDNWSVTYTGQLTDTFTAKAMYGVNKRSSLNGSAWDAGCSIVRLTGSNPAFPDPSEVGCHPSNSSVSSRYDKREATRLDFEWTLGDHLLRFGADQEVMDSDSSTVYPGDGVSYTAQALASGSSLPNGSVVPEGVNFIIDARRYITGAPVSTKAQAFYLEDNWSITPNLLLNLGVRADKFHNKLASGATFAEADFSDMISPRLGFSWDMKGDGTTKVFGNAGRYYLPLTNKLADYFGGGTTDEHTYYVLNGWTEQTDPINGGTYLFPDLGPQIGSVNTDGNAPAPDDLRIEVARDLKMVYQDEFILGFQQAINQAWSYGVNATFREVNRAVEDARINHIADCPSYYWDDSASGFPIINPGETNTLWCENEGKWVTFDSSEDGYLATGSGAVFGYKKPRRTYKAVEFQLDRAWDEKWAFNASYLWSKSEGNIEGPVNSDAGYADTNLVQFYDHPAVNERYGVLFNDHRHQFKLRGSYKLNEMFTFGATFSAISGGPITAFGVRWPNDNRSAGGPGEFSGGGSGWLCVSGCGDYTTRELVYTPRGAFGRMPWVTDVGVNVNWTIPVPVGDLSARFSIYNLFDNQAVVNVHSRYEGAPGVPLSPNHFGEGTVWQSPRYMQLVVTYGF
jgi:outer membrane receptor for ferrienterochelin and colicin